MKSIEVIVPRKLISEFYPHPEFYGDFVVKLVNGMYTDVYYQDEAKLITITNDEALIEYLNKQDVQPIDYLFRNGVFALRKIEPDDNELLKSWSLIYAKHKIKRIINHKTVSPILERILATYYCIEFGIVEFDIKDESHIFTLSVYDNRWIDELDINVCMDVLEEYLSEQ
ncbi:hypothetical protein RJI07_07865 [Mycoplasmatota bacterium WC30]